MAKKTKYIPEGYHTATPYLIVNGAGRAIEFYKQAFGATEVMRIGAPGGKVGHGETKIGDPHIMLADEHPEMEARSRKPIGGTPVGLGPYFEAWGAGLNRAGSCGGKVRRPLRHQCSGPA